MEEKDSVSKVNEALGTNAAEEEKKEEESKTPKNPMELVWE